MNIRLEIRFLKLFRCIFLQSQVNYNAFQWMINYSSLITLFSGDFDENFISLLIPDVVHSNYNLHTLDLTTLKAPVCLWNKTSNNSINLRVERKSNPSAAKGHQCKWENVTWCATLFESVNGECMATAGEMTAQNTIDDRKGCLTTWSMPGRSSWKHCAWWDQG